MAADHRTLGIGFVGAGWMGRALLERVLEHRDVALRGLYQRDRAGALEVLRHHGLPAALWTDDYRRLLDDPAVDAVFLCTPNALHGPQSIEALEAGKHVFCEKPCATRFDEFLRQLELEREHPDLVTLVDYILWFDPMEQRLRKLVESGSFGAIKQVQVNYRHPVNIEGDKAWKLDAATVGDAIGMGVIHAIWAMLHAMEPQAKPVSVFATSAPARSRPFEVDPIWTIQVQFDDGASGVCFGDIDGGVGYDAYHMLSGTDGAFVFDSLVEHPRKIRYRTRATTGDRWIWPLDPQRCAEEGFAELAWGGDTTTPDSGDVWKHQTGAVVAHFLDCLRDRTPSPLGFTATRSIAEVGWAALMSSSLHRPVDLPLDVEQGKAFFGAS